MLDRRSLHVLDTCPMKRTVSLTLTLPPVAHGALAALARLAGDDRAGRVVLALAFAEMERRSPGLWGRVASRAVASAIAPDEIAEIARRAFLDALGWGPTSNVGPDQAGGRGLTPAEAAERHPEAAARGLGDPDLGALLAWALAAHEALTPEQRAEHDARQRESFARGNNWGDEGTRVVPVGSRKNVPKAIAGSVLAALPTGAELAKRLLCPTCGGSGRWPHDGPRCGTCGGAGVKDPQAPPGSHPIHIPDNFIATGGGVSVQVQAGDKLGVDAAGRPVVSPSMDEPPPSTRALPFPFPPGAGKRSARHDAASAPEDIASVVQRAQAKREGLR